MPVNNRTNESPASDAASRRPLPRHSAHRTLAMLAAAIAVVAACSDNDPAADARATTLAKSSTLAPSTAPTPPAATNPAATAVPSDPSAATTEAVAQQEQPPTTVTDQLAAQIEVVLSDALAPGSIRWDAHGVDVPPTAAIAAVRVPGREDLLVAAGENLDGTPTEADAPFPVATLTESIVRTIAFQLVDEGVLDPTMSVDRWVPSYPNADRVTVQMLLDDATGWGDYGPVEPDPVVTDSTRAWSLREAVELRGPAMSTLGEPGTRTNDEGTSEMVLGLVAQEVAAKPLAELVRERVSEPIGLDDTTLLDGSNTPDRYRHGRFAYNGEPVPTSAFDGTAFLTWNLATSSVVSSPIDLLDLLDAWTTGELFTTDRTPAPDRYAPELVDDPSREYHIGLGVPFNGYCPCADVDGGIEPAAIGRTPFGLATFTNLFRYTDGISVVLNVNSGDVADAADVVAVANQIHDIAAAAH